MSRYVDISRCWVATLQLSADQRVVSGCCSPECEYLDNECGHCGHGRHGDVGQPWWLVTSVAIFTDNFPSSHNTSNHSSDSSVTRPLPPLQFSSDRWKLRIRWIHSIIKWFWIWVEWISVVMDTKPKENVWNHWCTCLYTVTVSEPVRGWKVSEFAFSRSFPGPSVLTIV